MITWLSEQLENPDAHVEKYVERLVSEFSHPDAKIALKAHLAVYGITTAALECLGYDLVRVVSQREIQGHKENTHQ